MKKHFIFFTLISLSNIVHAKAFKEIESCGLAVVTDGTACANLKVDFKFDGCKNNFSAHPAKSVTCEGEEALAKYQEGDFRYEARFKKSDNGWGAVAWKLDGAVKQFEREHHIVQEPIKKVEAPVKVNVKKEPDAVAVVAPVAETPLFKFGAFADVRYTNFSVKNDPLIPSGRPESGFGLEDGALYVNYDKGNVSAVMDIAFRRSKDVDTNSAAVKPNQSSNNNFAIGTDKSQLYIRYKMNPSVTFDLGQFDTIFGVEVNDSKDRVFGKTGLIYDYTLPVTHTGLMLEYSFLGSYYFKAFAANPNNKGSYGTSTTGDNSVEAGVAYGFANDNYHAQVGYMSRSIDKASGVARGDRSLFDVFAGGVLGKFYYDFECILLKDPNKNTLTPTDSNDIEKPSVGYLGIFSYKINPDFQLGARLEYLKNDPTAQGIKSSMAAGGSLHYKLTSELEIRSEYIMYKNKGLAGNKWDDNRTNIASVLTF